jgi:DNA-binding NarL/FixJ family response regulator
MHLIDAHQVVKNSIKKTTVKNRVTPTNYRKRVVLVDKHPVFRHGLRQLINEQPDLMAAGEADDARSALNSIATDKPDIVVMDLALKESMGIELIKDLKVQYSSLPVLVLSLYEESLYTERSLRAGAKGYIMKDEPPEEILIAIRRVLTGRIYLSSNMGTKLLSPIVNGCLDLSHSPVDRLSDRELEVFQLLGKAYETRQIAETLRVTIKTVESYREHIKVKLNVDNSTQLIRKAVEWVQTAGIG